MLRLSTAISGFKETIANLTHWHQYTVKQDLYQGTVESLEDLLVAMQTYPPESEANRPPHPYWARGVGRVHASGKIDPVSENYGQSWDLTVKETATGADGRLTNSASYAPWVGTRDKQAWFHAQRGWPVIEDEADKRGISIEKIAISSRIAQRIRQSISNLREKLTR